jgi:hypothetical protein
MAVLLTIGSLGFGFFVVFKFALGRAWLANLPHQRLGVLGRAKVFPRLGEIHPQ